MYANNIQQSVNITANLKAAQTTFIDTMAFFKENAKNSSNRSPENAATQEKTNLKISISKSNPKSNPNQVSYHSQNRIDTIPFFLIFIFN